ncbi:MAG: hypothetical protein ACRD1E_03515, partial [Terriglobales bacterium]
DYLATAMHLAPGDARVQLALGQAEAAAARDDQAAATLLMVAPGAPQYAEAQFDAALAEYRLGQFAAAAARLQTLSQRLPLPAVEDDLALAQAAARQPAGDQPPASQKLATDFPQAAFLQLQQLTGARSADQRQALGAAERAQDELRQGQRLRTAGALEAAAQSYRALLS